jgi:hypothetical protein
MYSLGRCSSSISGAYIQPLLSHFKDSNMDCRVLRQTRGEHKASCSASNYHVIVAARAELVGPSV